MMPGHRIAAASNLPDLTQPSLRSAVFPNDTLHINSTNSTYCSTYSEPKSCIQYLYPKPVSCVRYRIQINLLLSSTHLCVSVATYNNIYRNSPNPGIYLRNFKFPIQMPQQSTHRVHSYKVRNWLPINSLQHCTQQYATVQNRTLRFSREPLCTTNCRQGSTFFQTLSCFILYYFRSIVAEGKSAISMVNATNYLTISQN